MDVRSLGQQKVSGYGVGVALPRVVGGERWWRVGQALAVCGLLGVLLLGCGKHGASAEAALPKAVDLGTVQLTPGQPSRQELGGGRVCVLTARPMGNELELIAVLEKGGERVSSTRVGPVAIGRPLNLSFGELQVGVSPVWVK